MDSFYSMTEYLFQMFPFVVVKIGKKKTIPPPPSPKQIQKQNKIKNRTLSERFQNLYRSIIEIKLRNKSWKPECVGSFYMDWRILVFYPEPDSGMSKSPNTVVYFDWKTVIYIYVCGKCRKQFMLSMEMSVTFTGACANEIIPKG